MQLKIDKDIYKDENGNIIEFDEIIRDNSTLRGMKENVEILLLNGVNWKIISIIDGYITEKTTKTPIEELKEEIELLKIEIQEIKNKI